MISSLSSSQLHRGMRRLVSQPLWVRGVPSSSSSSSSTSTSSVVACRKFTSQGSEDPDRTVVIVDGVRLPFATASSIYKDERAVDLQRMALKGLLDKTALPPNELDSVICGTVLQEVRTSNIAREAVLGIAGVPHSVACHTVSMACISSSAAICAGAESIVAGRASVVMAGGVETFSDVPIRLNRTLRQTLLGLPKAMKQAKGKGNLVGGTLGYLTKQLSLNDLLAPIETPAIANYTTGEVMGVSSDRLAARFGVSREDQDVFAVRSHHSAARAHDDGFYGDEIVAYQGETDENGIQPSTSYEKMAKLKPAFVKPHGTHTAANSSFLTDGASASLLMSLTKARQLGYTPLAYLRDWTFRSCDPFKELLLGPTYCTEDLLRKHKLELHDFGVYEIHEAFAGQILSNLVAMDSQKFANENFASKTKVGAIDVDKMNTKGGSLSLGHPFGATGSRLVTTASRRLQQEEQRLALVAACADGGAGHACILERYDGPDLS